MIGPKIDRRTALALGASFAASVATGCAAPRPPAAAALALPFTFTDATPAFFSFWAAAERAPIDAQIARFRAEVVAPHAHLYTPAVLGLHGDEASAALDARLREWLPKLPSIAPRMRELHAGFERDMRRGVARLEAAAPTFRWSGACYLFASIDTMNGGMRDVDGKSALLFGLDVMAKPGASMPPEVLFAHELFHTHQDDVTPKLADGDARVGDALWTEGLAEHASLVVCEGRTEREALPFSHLHDPAHPALDIPERRVELAEVMPRYARSLGGELLAAFDSREQADYARFFLGRADPRLGERPVRSGYWFGLHAARVIAAGRSLDVLCRVPRDAVRAEVRAAVAEIVARAT
ncbi:MAG TPA: hypothetical protein VGM56_32990 [Byssovorax sp.]